MGKLKNLAVDLIEYEDEIHDLLNRISIVSPATIRFIFIDTASEAQIQAGLIAFCLDHKDEAIVVEITAIAIGMKLIDKETLKLIPLDLTLEVTNDINTEIT